MILFAIREHSDCWTHLHVHVSLVVNSMRTRYAFFKCIIEEQTQDRIMTHSLSNVLELKTVKGFDFCSIIITFNAIFFFDIDIIHSYHYDVFERWICDCLTIKTNE